MVDVPSYEPEVLIRDYGNAEMRETSEAMSGFREDFPDVKVRQEVMKGSPVKSLVKAGEHAQLLVVGSRGLGGFRGLLLGSVSHAVVHKGLYLHGGCRTVRVRVGVVTFPGTPR